MRYFRVYTGFTEYIPIDETELEKALYAVITGNTVVFNMGSTSRIDRVIPDWHKAMGINPEWKFDVDDWNECDKQGHKKKYAGVIGDVKDKVQYLIESKQENLIGNNVKILEFEKKEVKSITERFK